MKLLGAGQTKERKQINYGLKNRIRLAAVVCAAAGWWGLLYPELTLTPDTYRVIGEDGQEIPEEDMTCAENQVGKKDMTCAENQVGKKDMTCAENQAGKRGMTCAAEEEALAEGNYGYIGLFRADSGHIRVRSKLYLTIRKWLSESGR